MPNTNIIALAGEKSNCISIPRVLFEKRTLNMVKFVLRYIQYDVK